MAASGYNISPNAQVLHNVQAAHRQNSFDFVRLCAALAVLFSHHFALSGKPEPIVPVFEDTLGGVAVYIFFTISGFLIYNSLIRNSNWASFFAARLLRLIPNLIMALIFSSALMLVWYNNYDNIVYHISFVVRNFFMFFADIVYFIPGILEGRPNSGVNGSLWTLPYEFWMYVLLFLTFILRPYLRMLSCLLILGGFSYLSSVGRWDDIFNFFEMHPNTAAVGKLGLQFFCGVVVGIFWPIFFGGGRKIELKNLGILFLLVLLVILMPRLILNLSIAFFIISICMSKSLSFVSRIGDMSYGIYIFAFPIQQILIQSVKGFYSSMLISALCTVFLSYVTWHVYEQKALLLRESFAAVLSWPFSKAIVGYQRDRP